MKLNPEFRRYCWLELTPHRLIAAPVIAGLILALVAASSHYSTEALAMTGLGGFVACALLYGGYLAHDTNYVIGVSYGQIAPRDAAFTKRS